ncbi:MAG TPA: hypothetical protein VHL34_00530 [Rhizomicrobium sp.]|jgi:hypothetical protein|nr:hypothetical protein [Rhizomicrobium sp.]
MRKLALVLAASVLASAVSPALAGPLCLDTYRVDTTKVPDDSHIVFRLVDGSEWQNTLPRKCPGLKSNRFSYEPGAGRDICENVQIIKVLEQGNACTLGGFTKIKPASVHS